MIKNYFKIFIRNSWRNLGFTAINVTGLSVGLASCLIIALFVLDELSYDNFHPAKDRIFRVVGERISADGVSANAFVPNPLSNSLSDSYAEIKHILDLTPAVKRLFEVDDKKFYEENGYFSDPTFPLFFNIGFLLGNSDEVLNNPYSIVITEKMASKYFGNDWRSKDLLSRSIKINNNQEYAIEGVIENLPSNFHLQFDFLISSTTLEIFLSDYDQQNWLSPGKHCYLLLNDASQSSLVEDEIRKGVNEYVDQKTQAYGFEYNFRLQPLSDIHLYSAALTRDSAKRGNIVYVTSLIFVALIILLLACANFVNISTARATKRSKEVGLRKVVGARRSQIILQFLSEAILFSIISLLIGALLVEVTLPFFNPLFQKELSLDIFGDLQLLLALLSILLLTGVLAGSFSAFYLSSFRPVKILKKQAGSLGFGKIRKVLVVFQFTTTAVLIMSALVILSQLRYMQNKDMGFEKEKVVVFPIRGKEMRANLESFKSRAIAHSGIEAISATSGLPGFYVQGDEILFAQTQTLLPSKIMLADADIVSTLGMQIVAGRSFLKDRISDASSAFIINEAAARAMGWSNSEAIGQEAHWDIWVKGDTLKKGDVIGVVKNFHYLSMEEEIGPMVIHSYTPDYSFLAARLKGSDFGGALTFLEEHYENYSANFPFEYHFLDDDFAAKYKSESDFAILLQVFTGLAVIIACLGLIGLTAFSTERRRKEISIRKVYGASIAQVLALINNQFMQLVGISILIALPVGYYLTSLWLDNYAYRIDSVFSQLFFAGLVSLLLALLSVSYLVVRAALTNPAEVLRNE
ncbi:MAG: FtsX-like permease family protein [Bacteroidota bacterium]